MIPCKCKISFHGHLHFWVPLKQRVLSYAHVHICSWLKVANGQLRTRTVRLAVTLQTATTALWWLSPQVRGHEIGRIPFDQPWNIVRGRFRLTNI